MTPLVPVPGHWLCLAAWLLLCGGVWHPVAAQEYGQWTWDASLGVRGRHFSNDIQGQETSRTRHTNLGLALGMDGYIMHPAFAHFRLGADFLYTDTTVQGRDNKAIGLNAALEFLPTSRIPSRFFFADQQFDYFDLSFQDPLISLRSPDRNRNFGGSLNSRRGAFRGMTLAVRRTEISFLDPNSREDVQQQERFEWVRNFGRLAHAFKLEHNARQFGITELDYDDLVGSLDERRPLGERWTWNLNASAFRRKSISDGLPESRNFLGQMNNRFRRDLNTNEWFEIRQRSVRSEQGNINSDMLHGLTLTWNRPLGRGWAIAPFADYSRLTGNIRQVTAPLLGLTTVWQGQGERLDGTFNASTSFGDVQTDLATETSSNRAIAVLLSGSLGHGVAQGGLRKEITVAVSRNELRLERELVDGLPDPVTPLGGLGLENTFRARGSLRHHRNSRQFLFTGEWRLRESQDALTTVETSAQRLYGTLEYSAGQLQVLADIAGTEVERSLGQDEKLLGAGIRARWQPWRLVALRARYRRDERNLVLTPDIDSDRYEVGADVQLGQTVLRVGYYVVVNRLEARDNTTRGNLIWSLSRRFGGLLPVRTGKARRGTIR